MRSTPAKSGNEFQKVIWARRALLLFVCFLVPLEQANAAEVRADSDWVMDGKAKTGNAVIKGKGQGGAWTLGDNLATTKNCTNGPKKTTGRKWTLAMSTTPGGDTQRLNARCQYTGAIARAEATSHSSITVDVWTFNPVQFQIHTHARAEAKSDTRLVFTTEAFAKARYDDPILLEKISPDFVLSKTVKLRSGAAIKATAENLKSRSNQATLSLSAGTDVSGLETLYAINISANGASKGELSINVDFSPSPFVSFVDPGSGQTLQGPDVAQRLRDSFLYELGTQTFQVLNDIPLFDVRIRLGETGRSEALLGYGGAASALAIDQGKEFPEQEPPPEVAPEELEAEIEQ